MVVVLLKAFAGISLNPNYYDFNLSNEIYKPENTNLMLVKI